MTVAPASCIHVLAMLPTITPIKTENMCRLRQGKNEQITRSKNIWRDQVAWTPPKAVPFRTLLSMWATRDADPRGVMPPRHWYMSAYLEVRGALSRACTFISARGFKHGHFAEPASKGRDDDVRLR